MPEVPWARPVPHAPEPDPESAPQAPTLPQQSPPWKFPCPDKTVYGHAAPPQAVYSIVRPLEAPLPQPEEPVLHREVQVAASGTQPLASASPELEKMKAELDRIRHRLRISTSPRAQAIAREIDQPRTGPTEGLLAPCQEWNHAKSEPSPAPGEFIQETAAPSFGMPPPQAGRPGAPALDQEERLPAPCAQEERPDWGPQKGGTTPLVGRHLGSGGGRVGREIP